MNGYVIKEHLADIGKLGRVNEWTVQANVVNWYGHGDAIDIRAWQNKSYSDGITLDFETARNLMYALAEWYGVEIQNIDE